jgi:hypothetical protein
VLVALVGGVVIAFGIVTGRLLAARVAILMLTLATYRRVSGP